LWTQYIPKSVERSTYVLLSSLTLLLLFWQWRPMPAIVWHVEEPDIAAAITGLSYLGWVIVFTSTFRINHFELFGLHQVVNNLAGRDMPAPTFRTPLYYKLVRHPLYLGFIIAFWAAPNHERRASALRRGDHRLHICRHHAGRARSHRFVR
jgi:methanethiol S-methyltransferase